MFAEAAALVLLSTDQQQGELVACFASFIRRTSAIGSDVGDLLVSFALHLACPPETAVSSDELTGNPDVILPLLRSLQEDMGALTATVAARVFSSLVQVPNSVTNGTALLLGLAADYASAWNASPALLGAPLADFTKNLLVSAAKHWPPQVTVDVSALLLRHVSASDGFVEGCFMFIFQLNVLIVSCWVNRCIRSQLPTACVDIVF
jgi:hypothetical protein